MNRLSSLLQRTINMGWVNRNVDPSHTQVFFQGASPVHYYCIVNQWKRVERATEFMQGPSPVVHGTKISRRIALRLGCGEQSVEPNQEIRPYLLDITTSRSVARTHTQVSTMPLVSPDTWNLLLLHSFFLHSFNR
ncbi:unnamed protein product [Brassica oleracea var. botrytis]